MQSRLIKNVMIAVVILLVVIISIIIALHKPKEQNEISTQEEPSLTQEEPSLTQEEPSIVQEEPSMQEASTEGVPEGLAMWEELYDENYIYTELSPELTLDVDTCRVIAIDHTREARLDVWDIEVMSQDEAKECDVLTLCGEHYIDSLSYYVSILTKDGEQYSCVFLPNNTMVSDF